MEWQRKERNDKNSRITKKSKKIFYFKKNSNIMKKNKF